MAKLAVFAAVLSLASGLSSLAQSSKNVAAQPQVHRQCQFADGKSIDVDYPETSGVRAFDQASGYRGARFTSNQNLITIQGRNVEAGEYDLSIVPSRGAQMLVLTRIDAERDSAGRLLSSQFAPLPMSMTRLRSPIEGFTISFDHTGGSCRLKAQWENTQAALEFAEPNTDLPLIP